MAECTVYDSRAVRPDRCKARVKDVGQDDPACFFRQCRNFPQAGSGGVGTVKYCSAHLRSQSLGQTLVDFDPAQGNQQVPQSEFDDSQLDRIELLLNERFAALETNVVSAIESVARRDARMERNIETLARQRDEAGASNDELRRIVGDLQNESGQVQRERARIQQELESADTKRAEELRESDARLQEQLEQLKTQTAEAADLRRQLGERDDALAKLTASAEETRQALQDSESRLRTLQSEFDALKESDVSSSERIDRLQADVEVERAKLGEAQREHLQAINTLKENNLIQSERVESRLAALRQRIGELQASADRPVADVDQQTASLDPVTAAPSSSPPSSSVSTSTTPPVQPDAAPQSSDQPALTARQQRALRRLQ